MKVMKRIISFLYCACLFKQLNQMFSTIYAIR